MLLISCSVNIVLECCQTFGRPSHWEYYASSNPSSKDFISTWENEMQLEPEPFHYVLKSTIILEHNFRNSTEHRKWSNRKMSRVCSAPPSPFCLPQEVIMGRSVRKSSLLSLLGVYPQHAAYSKYCLSFQAPKSRRIAWQEIR